LSVDGTVAEIHRLIPAARVVHQTAKGKGAALRAGFEAATGEIIAMVDADGSTQLSELGAFVDVLGAGADVAKGSRYLRGGGSDDITPLRSLGNRSITGMVNALWGTAYTDTCYGYMAFWRRHLDVLMPECDGFEVETYLSLKATVHGLAVAEVESWERTRWSGESNLHAGRDGLRIAKTILKEWASSRRPGRSRPTASMSR
jgi:glycosyltransferase involved in cell wall biosynthesis